jgi:hypothetical protein
MPGFFCKEPQLLLSAPDVFCESPLCFGEYPRLLGYFAACLCALTGHFSLLVFFLRGLGM